MIIREETQSDISAIRALNKQAFPGDSEANIVDALRDSGGLVLSLVATLDDRIIGHIAFSEMSFGEQREVKNILALAPMAVTPNKQNKGIGSALINEAIIILKERGIDGLLLIGHPNFYPRFGFNPVGPSYGFNCEYEVPEEVFMGLELTQGALSSIKEKAYFREEFKSQN